MAERFKKKKRGTSEAIAEPNTRFMDNLLLPLTIGAISQILLVTILLVQVFQKLHQSRP